MGQAGKGSLAWKHDVRRTLRAATWKKQHGNNRPPIQGEIDELRQDYLQIRVLELAPEVYASAQLFEHDVRLVAKQGVRSIVNNRTDGESMGQPLSADLAKVAEEFGVAFVHFPIDLQSITRQDVEAFARICDELKRPLLLFSRSGARSTKIWEMTEEI